MSVFYTSDPHFDHERIIEFCHRPFSTIEEMGWVIVARWLEIVKPDDTVYVLGDVTGGGLGGLRWIKHLSGRKILIAGNHDQCHPMHEGWAKALPKYRDAGFEEIMQFATRKIDKHRVLLSHFPYAADHTDTPRFNPYRLRDEGMPLIHGHIHQSTREDGHQFHVGMDAHDFRPVPEHVIVNWLDGLELAA